MAASDIQIAPARPDDLAALGTLLHDMERHYHGEAPGEPADTADRIAATLFGAAPCAEALLARDAGEPAGVAIFTRFFPARHLSTGLYLTDLYVMPLGRGRGIGRALMTHLALLARERGCSRIDWSTDLDNAAARALYRSLGAAERSVWRYQLEGTALAALGAGVGGAPA